MTEDAGVDPQSDMDSIATQQQQIARAAELAPRLLGEEVGTAVEMVLLDHSEGPAVDPNIAELATLLLHRASCTPVHTAPEVTAQMETALGALRAAHHVPYEDEEHQGGNCADLLLAYVTRIGRLEHALDALLRLADAAGVAGLDEVRAVRAEPIVTDPLRYWSDRHPTSHEPTGEAT